MLGDVSVESAPEITISYGETAVQAVKNERERSIAILVVGGLILFALFVLMLYILWRARNKRGAAYQ